MEEARLEEDNQEAVVRLMDIFVLKLEGATEEQIQVDRKVDR